MVSSVIETAKLLALRLGLVRTRYEYMLEPSQFLELMLALKRGEDLKGDIIEVGVARGKTTIFLNRYLDELDSNKVYFAVDTFGGFTPEDVQFEQENRGKRRYRYQEFSFNSRQTWEKSVIRGNGIRRVKVIANDIKRVNFDDNQRFSTALLDVDLYLPTIASLELIYPRMVPGGTLIVDDVRDNSRWDGAHRAFLDFVKRGNINYRLALPKCGVIDC